MAQFFDFKEDYYGLTDSEINKNLKMYGHNTYTKEGKKSAGFSAGDVFLSPSVIIMLVAGVLCFFGMGVGAGIVTILLCGIYCGAEIYFGMTSDKRLSELKESTTMKFRAIRGGAVTLVDKENIVPEDIIVVQAGERVPADAFILESRDVTCDESVFSGDSKPVAKYTGGISDKELKPTFVYSGSTVLSGIAVCKVSATGVDTRIYQHRGSTPDRHSYYTTLERIARGLVPVCSCIALLLTLLSVIIRITSGGDPAFAAISGITLGLCFIPTAIAAVIRYYYTKGSSELLRNGAVVKSFSDIEKLNSLSVLCVEKEGAISKNRLEIRGIYARSEELLYKVAALACGPNSNDPAERALLVKATFFDEKISQVFSENEFIEKLPDSGDTISGGLWRVGGDEIYCIKGTPEQILPMCRLNGDTLLAAQKRYQDYYENGCTVLAFACVEADSGELDKTQGFSYTFVGFAAFSAPLRDSVSTAVKICKKAGVRVVMLTEENPSVAVSTAKMIGISAENVITGSKIDSSRKNGLALDCTADIYAKISPNQKLYIIDRLKRNGDVVAMTGTRSTDAEALDEADIGITITAHCAGSTCESADIMMNDDNFLSIAETISRARQIHRNIKRGAALMISGYVGLMLTMICNLFGNEQLMLNPPVLALITMILLPLLAVGYAGGKPDMQSGMPPSEFVATRKLNFKFIADSALTGVFSGIVTVASYALMYNGSNFGFARSCALISYLVCTAAIAVLRYSDENPFTFFGKSGTLAKASVAVCVLLPVFLCYIPVVNECFGLGMIDVLALLISVLTGILPAVIYFFIKRFIKLKEI